MPLTVLEGFACGKPVVGSRVGGVPEVAPDEQYGLLVAPGDPDALAGALAAAMDRTWDAAAIRARAQEFGWPAVVDGIRTVYAEMIPGA
jgi:glycosyltransferase involved in cell wall biosynthesis